MNPFAEVIYILVDLYISIILIRFFLQYYRADFNNPLSQFVVRATDPLVKPLRKIVPGLGGIDLSTLVLAYLLIIAKLLFLTIISSQAEINILLVLLISITSLCQTILLLFMYLIFIRIVISWVSPGSYSPVIQAIAQITQPIINKCRPLTPKTEGFDLSMFVTLVILFLAHQSISYWIIPIIGNIAI